MFNTKAMTGRGEKTYYRKDNGKPITAEDRYRMVMLYTHHKMPVHKIARKFAIDTVVARLLIGKRTGGSCCG